MKKFLSVLLAVMMVLSTVSFAAPSLAGVADTAVEAPAVEEAPVADLAADENILKAYEFTSGTEGVAYVRNWVNEHDKTNGYLKVYPGESPEKLNDVHSGGTIAPNVVVSELADIQVKVRFTNFTGSSYSTCIYTGCDGAAATPGTNGTEVTLKNVEGTNVNPGSNDWQIVSVKNSFGTSWSNFVKGTKLTLFRLDLSPKNPANCIFEIDYMHFIGYPTENLALDMGDNADVADQTIKVTEYTTVIDALAKIDLSAYTGDLVPKGLVDGETRLAADAKVIDYIEKGLTVLWAAPTNFGYDFDTALETESNWKPNSRYNPDVVTEGDNKMLKLVAGASENGDHRIVLSDLNILPGELEGIYLTLKASDASKFANDSLVYWSDYGADGWSTGASYFNGGSVNYNTSLVSGTIADNEWFTVYFDADKIKHTSKVVGGGADNTTLKENGVRTIRFDTATGVANTTIWVDDVVLVGAPEFELVADLSGAGLANQKLSYTASTTAEVLLSKIDLDDYTGILVPQAVKVGTTVLDSDEKIADYVSDGDTVTIVWRKDFNIYAGSEFTSGMDGITVGYSNGSLTSVVSDDVLTITSTGDMNNVQLDIPCNMPAGALKSIEIKIKSNTTLESFNGASYYQLAGDTGYGQNNHSNGLTWPAFTKDEWQVVKLDALAKNIANKNLDLINCRIDLQSTFATDVAFDIDYIRFYCDTFVVNVDMGTNTEAPDETYGVPTNMTTQGFLDMVADKTFTAYVPVAAKDADGTTIPLTAKLADYVADGDTVTIEWESAADYYNVLKSWEFSTRAEGGLNNMDEAATTNKNGVLKTKMLSSKGEIYFNHNFAADDIIYFSEISDIVMRARFTDTSTNSFTGSSGTYQWPDNWETWNRANPTYTIIAGKWIEFSFLEMYGLESFDNFLGGQYFKGFRSPQFLRAHLGDFTIEVDYIRILGKPAKPVNVNMAGVCDDVVGEYKKTTTVAELIESLEYPTTAKIAGLSATKGGTALEGTALVADVLAEAETDTLYAIWNNVGALSFSYEFDTDAGYSFKTFTHGLTNPNTGFESTDYVDYYKTYVYGAGNAYGEDYITWNEDGYITLNYAASEEHKAAAAAANATAVLYDSVVYFEGLDGAPDQKGIAAGAVDEIIVKYRYNGTILDAGAAIYKADGSTGTANAAKPYFYYSNGGNPITSANTTLPVVTGEWQVAVLPASAFGLDSSVLDWLRFDVPDAMPDGASFDIDYIRFIGKPVEAPNTDYAPELRNIADEEYDNAIRFKASISSATDANVSEIGWLVSTEAYLGTNELTIDKYVEGSSKVKVAYKRAATDTDKDSVAYYDASNDEELIFAAFVYNIPAKNAYDNIVVRPFVVSGGLYYYGEAVATNLYDMAIADMIEFNTEYGIDSIATAKSFMGMADTGANLYSTAVEYGLMSTTAEYGALDADQKTYVDSVIAALFEL